MGESSGLCAHHANEAVPPPGLRIQLAPVRESADVNPEWLQLLQSEEGVHDLPLPGHWHTVKPHSDL